MATINIAVDSVDITRGRSAFLMTHMPARKLYGHKCHFASINDVYVVVIDPFHNSQARFSALHLCLTNGGICPTSNGDRVLVKHAGAHLLRALMSRYLNLHFPRLSASKLRLNTPFAESD